MDADEVRADVALMTSWVTSAEAEDDAWGVDAESLGST